MTKVESKTKKSINAKWRCQSCDHISTGKNCRTCGAAKEKDYINAGGISYDKFFGGSWQ